MSAEPVSQPRITALLLAHAQGDRGAMNSLMPLIYARLHTIAHDRLSRESRAPFQTTALVHEAYLRLIDQTRCDWKGRAHFFALASITMRRILINAAKARDRDKRNGGVAPQPLTTAVRTQQGPVNLLELDDALHQLAKLDQRASEVVVCRFFGGLTIAETAVALDVSPMTVKRTWKLSQAWLHRELFDG